MRLLRMLLAMLLAALSLLLPAARAGAGETYTLFDAAGARLTCRGGRMYVGDEYISGDNRRYRVVAVDDAARTARAEAVQEAAPALSSAVRAGDAQQNAGDEKRLICMYSTHSDESYTPTDGEYSKWEDAGIYDVGNALKDALEARGIDVIYSEETFLPHDAEAYNRSRSTAEELIRKGPDALLDIHRDAIPAEEYETTVDGEDVSKIRLFVGRSNQNRAANEAFAKEIKAVADEKYPGLIKDIYIGKGNYNQELYPQALLLEMGTDDIEKDKVIDSTKYIAEVLDEVLFGTAAKAAEADDADAAPAASGIAWAVGLAILAAAVYALASTGSLGGMWSRMKRGASEMTGGLFGGKKDD